MTAPAARRHLLVSAGLFVILVVIALFVRDRWIRPFGGDLLVVIWLYHLIRGVARVSRHTAAWLVLGIALTLEAAQALQLVERLGLDGIRVAEVVLGTTADPWDAAMYVVGTLLAVLTDRVERTGPAGSSESPGAS